MGGSRVGWAVGSIARWWLGAALAMSMPADAGQETGIGGSRAALSWRAPATPTELVPTQIAGLGGDLPSLSGLTPRILLKASLAVGEPEEFTRLPDELEPRADLKPNPPAFPRDVFLMGQPTVTQCLYPRLGWPTSFLTMHRY